MGVKGCSRSGCDSIMCDTYVHNIGYVCYDCQREFKKHLEKEQITVKTESEINKELLKFMDTIKDYTDDDKEMSVDDFFNRFTE